MGQKPSIGRIVHYNLEGLIVPAIITLLNLDGSIDLTLFPPGQNPVPVRKVRESNDIDCWRWPERV